MPSGRSLVPGRIRDEDVVAVRERAAIGDVVAEAGVQLRSAGSGRLKGLCPFHDEKSPSFNVNPAVGYYMCFGCGESGDVISFVRKHDQLSFPEAVEHLARRFMVELHYEQGGAAAGRSSSQRSRLVEAHKVAAEYFAEQLAAPGAGPGRAFLAERGFDQGAASAYGVGFAPQGWDNLVKHLRGRGFSTEEVLAGGLASQGRQGPIDRFRYRLVWPIRDISGDVIGFGARKLSTDPADDSPKYLNSPETPIYKKSTVLYGLDLAKKQIARRRQAVVVEGYTDVMACHLAGVPTAVATCGTAFGSDHIGVIRRLLMDQDEFRGEVVFTFDGDTAGQKAALKAFGEDQRFVGQTYIAVSPGGMDPCELRLARGDVAVRDLVSSRVPLVEFAVKASLARYDLDSAEGRVQALGTTAPLVAQIRDRALSMEYARRLSGWLGMDEASVRERVGGLTGAGRGPTRRPGPAPSADASQLRLEREALKLAVQSPTTVAPIFDELHDEVFTDAGLRRVQETVRRAGGVVGAVAGEFWVARLLEHCPDDGVRSLVMSLAVEAPLTEWELERYGEATLTRLQLFAVTRRVVELKGKLQRLNPVEQEAVYARTMAELFQLEATARAFRERGISEL